MADNKYVFKQMPPDTVKDSSGVTWTLWKSIFAEGKNQNSYLASKSPTGTTNSQFYMGKAIYYILASENGVYGYRLREYCWIECSKGGTNNWVSNNFLVSWRNNQTFTQYLNTGETTHACLSSKSPWFVKYGGSSSTYTDKVGWGSYIYNWPSISFTTQARTRIIRFYNNDGTNNYVDVTKTFNTPLKTLPTPTRSGYTFVGWGTTKTETVAASNVGQTDASTYNVTNPPMQSYYAIWRQNALTVSYNLNGENGEIPTASTSSTGATSFSVTIPSLTVTGKILQGWSSTSGVNNTVNYEIGKSYTFTKSTTLYAVWQSDIPVVNFTYKVLENNNYQIIANYDYSQTSAMGKTSFNVWLQVIDNQGVTRSTYDSSRTILDGQGSLYIGLGNMPTTEETYYCYFYDDGNNHLVDQETPLQGVVVVTPESADYFWQADASDDNNKMFRLNKVTTLIKNGNGKGFLVEDGNKDKYGIKGKSSGAGIYKNDTEIVDLYYYTKSNTNIQLCIKMGTLYLNCYGATAQNVYDILSESGIEINKDMKTSVSGTVMKNSNYYPGYINIGYVGDSTVPGVAVRHYTPGSSPPTSSIYYKPGQGKTSTTASGSFYGSVVLPVPYPSFS